MPSGDHCLTEAVGPSSDHYFIDTVVPSSDHYSIDSSTNMVIIASLRQ